jgi:predicted RNase H-like HicB family nuclease
VVAGAILKEMLRYHVAYFLPRGDDRMVVAEVLDFPGVVTQGFDLADARLMAASALEDIAQIHLEEGRPLPVPNPDATAADADLIELTIFSNGCRLDRADMPGRCAVNSPLKCSMSLFLYPC